MNQLKELFNKIFSEGELVRIIFSAMRKKSLPYSKVTVRPVKLSGSGMFQWEYTFNKKVTQRNLDADESSALAVSLIFSDFKDINVFTISEDIHILASKPEKPRITHTPATRGMPSLAHNKTKNYIIANGSPTDFLIRLGVMDPSGKVIQKHYSKFRQINRYLEIVEDVFEYLPTERTIRIIDFGCGKAYLTFALYYYLKILKNCDVDIIGLDLKEDVISFCSKAAADLGYDGLNFFAGDIAHYTGGEADMVVTLHACDTATDYALINATAWNARVILSVPCCQHELFSQIKNSVHQPMLKHGILKDRLTEYLTDGLRGLKLESRGYDVAMIEFTSLEHTARNIMIKAVKTGSPCSASARQAQHDYEALRDFYQVKPTIDML